MLLYVIIINYYYHCQSLSVISYCYVLLYNVIIIIINIISIIIIVIITYCCKVSFANVYGQKEHIDKGEKHHLQGGIIPLFWDLVVYSLWALDHSTN